jgi:hypothetical protein
MKDTTKLSVGVLSLIAYLAKKQKVPNARADKTQKHI